MYIVRVHTHIVLESDNMMMQVDLKDYLWRESIKKIYFLGDMSPKPLNPFGGLFSLFFINISLEPLLRQG